MPYGKNIMHVAQPKPRWDTLIELINEGQFTHIAEVGVANGSTLKHIVAACPQLEVYLAVDIKIDESLKTIGPPVQLMEMTSLKAASQVKDHSLDLVFIDASHIYKAVKADIAAWKPKVKLLGTLAGHDYWIHSHSLPHLDGVKKAVDEAFSNGILLANDKSVHRDCYVWQRKI